MKKLLLIPCFVLLVSLCFSQAAPTIIKNGACQEVYEMLASQPDIKQGKYEFVVSKTCQLLTSGYYKNNRPDSLWCEYDNEGHLIAKGNYRDGRKFGSWNYYDAVGVVINTYDFTNNKLIFHKATKRDSTYRYKVIKGSNDTLITVLSHPPVYLGGDALMYRPFTYNIDRPFAAFEKKLVGQVIITFVLDDSGEPNGYKVEKGLGYGCDEEALRLVKLIPDNWVAGRLNDKSVSVVIRLPVTFDFSGAKVITEPFKIIYHSTGP